MEREELEERESARVEVRAERRSSGLGVIDFWMCVCALHIWNYIHKIEETQRGKQNFDKGGMKLKKGEMKKGLKDNFFMSIII